jgi:hypothetical protein
VFIDELFEANGGLATAQQLLAVMSKRSLAYHLKTGAIVRVWRGIYSLSPPDTLGKLAGLDLIAGMPMVACVNTAAELHGFNTERSDRIHVLDPGVRMRPVGGLMVHQRVGAPLKRAQGRLATTPAWTAVEMARMLRRPRALAILDAALHSRACTQEEINAAIDEQKGRRGIVNVREIMAFADGRAESAMESEARLVFIDGGLPLPELQLEIIDRCDDLWRVDFAWPDAMLVVEYESVEWHANAAAFKRSQIRTARLQECGYTVLPIVADDVRRWPADLVARIMRHLDRAQLAG